MRKTALFPAIFALFFASVVSAQNYYPNYSYSYPTVSSGGCVVLTSDLSYRSRGFEVRQLQSFLVSLGYPGGGSWMITGFYGRATTQAVRNFQQSMGLPITGWVDWQTRNAIQNRSCGGNTYIPQYPTYPTYGNVTITSLSNTTGAPGSSLTIYGTGFDYYNNTVYVGGTSVPNVTSYNGTSLTVTVPWNAQQGTVQVYVWNTRGTSNSMNFTVTGTYNNYCQYGYSYNCYGNLSLTSLSTNSAQVGQSVTVYGTGFDPYNNTVYVGGTSVSAVQNGSTQLIFTVPNLSAGSYNVYVTNSRGTSNALSLTIGSGGTTCGYYPYQNCAYPSITSLNPSSGAVGAVVTVYGSGFSYSGNSVRFGVGLITSLSSTDGTSLTFTVPSTLSGYGYQNVTPGTYPVSVINAQGQTSNAMNFYVTSGSASGAPTIGSVTGPNSLAVGQQGTWTVQVSAPSGTYVTTSVTWGDEGYSGAQASSPQQTYIVGTQTLTFTHTYQQSGTFTVRFTVSNSAGTNSATATVTVGGSTTGAATVSIANFAFSPSTITVRQGTTVTWTNQDTAQHTVTSDTGVFGSANLNQYGTFSYTFNTQGTFRYHCSIHPSMIGWVVVTP